MMRVLLWSGAVGLCLARRLRDRAATWPESTRESVAVAGQAGMEPAVVRWRIAPKSEKASSHISHLPHHRPLSRYIDLPQN